jgi:thioredoxin-like negative regulator of GroEL
VTAPTPEAGDQYSGWVPADQVQQMIDQALQQHASTANEAAAGSISAEQAQAMIDQALARQAEAHNSAMQALAESMRGTVATFVPRNAGGPGTEISETWSQYEQTQAHAADAAATAEAAKKVA